MAVQSAEVDGAMTLGSLDADSLTVIVPLVLLQIAGLVGGVDLLYYHNWKFKLYQQTASRLEHITHLVRTAQDG
jgi:hypothetical protein